MKMKLILLACLVSSMAGAQSAYITRDSQPHKRTNYTIISTPTKIATAVTGGNRWALGVGTTNTFDIYVYPGTTNGVASGYVINAATLPLFQRMFPIFDNREWWAQSTDSANTGMVYVVEER